MSGSSIRMKMIWFLQGLEVFVDHCSEAGEKNCLQTGIWRSDPSAQIFFKTFCMPCVFYLLKVSLRGLPEFLGPGLGVAVIRNLLSTLYSSCLNVFSVPRFLFNVWANIVGEVEIPTGTLQGETWAHKGIGDWHGWLTGKKWAELYSLCLLWVDWGV